MPGKNAWVGTRKQGRNWSPTRGDASVVEPTDVPGPTGGQTEPVFPHECFGGKTCCSYVHLSNYNRARVFH